MGGRRSSRSDPAQVRVWRLGTTTSLGTCVSGLGFEKLRQDLSMWPPGLSVRPRVPPYVLTCSKTTAISAFSILQEVLVESTDPGASCGVQTPNFIRNQRLRKVFTTV